jgi:hypothetical protein
MLSSEYFDFPVPLSSHNCPMSQFSPPSTGRHTAFLVFTYTLYSTDSWFLSALSLKLIASLYQTLLLFFPLPLPAKSSLSINDFLLGSCTTKFLVLRLLSFFLLSLPFAGLSFSPRLFHYILFFLKYSQFLTSLLSVPMIKSVVQFNVHSVTTDSKQLITNR